MVMRARQGQLSPNPPLMMHKQRIQAKADGLLDRRLGVEKSNSDWSIDRLQIGF
jgi:hypothetical protein